MSHLRRVRRRHRQRRDATIAAIIRNLSGAHIQGAAAGLHLTILLPNGIDDISLAASCLDAGPKV